MATVTVFLMGTLAPRFVELSFWVGRDCDLASGTHGLVAMTSAQHAEGRQFDPGWM